MSLDGRHLRYDFDQHVERAGDLMTNVAERVICMVTGQMHDLNPGTMAEARR